MSLTLKTEFDGAIHTKQKSVQNFTFWRKKGNLALKKANIAIGYVRLKINSQWLKIVSFMSVFKASGLLMFPLIKITCTFREKKPLSASLLKDRI